MKGFKKITAIVLSAAAAVSIGTTTVFADWYYKNGVWAGEELPYSEPATIFDEKYFETDRLTLVSKEETVDGDYRIVDRIYTDGIMTFSDYGRQKFYAFRDIYYERNTDSIFLATMSINAYYSWNASRNEALVESDTAVCVVNRRDEGQWYPHITEISRESKNNHGGLFFGKKYAYIKYILDVERAKDDHMVWGLELDVNVNGKPTVKRLDSSGTFN